jgi:hypothetical protein
MFLKSNKHQNCGSRLVDKVNTLLFYTFTQHVGAWNQCFFSANRYHGPSCTMWAWANDNATSHSSEQYTLPTTSHISKQVIPYRTRDDTCYPGMSTPKIQSLADSSMTNHNTWRNPTVSTISNLAQTTASNLNHSHLTPRWMEDQYSQHSTQAKLNIIKWKTCTMTQDYMTKQYY